MRACISPASLYPRRHIAIVVVLPMLQWIYPIVRCMIARALFAKPCILQTPEIGSDLEQPESLVSVSLDLC